MQEFWTSLVTLFTWPQSLAFATFVIVSTGKQNKPLQRSTLGHPKANSSLQLHANINLIHKFTPIESFVGTCRAKKLFLSLGFTVEISKTGKRHIISSHLSTHKKSTAQPRLECTFPKCWHNNLRIRGAQGSILKHIYWQEWNYIDCERLVVYWQAPEPTFVHTKILLHWHFRL